MWTATFIFWLSAGFLYTLHGFPLSDDWTFTSALEQLFHGTPVTLDHLQLANLFVAWIGLLTFYWTMRRLGAGSGPARAGLLTLLANPLFLMLSFYLTPHILVLTLMLIAGHAYITGAQGPSLGWLAFGSIVATAACFLKPIVVCMTIGFTLWMLVQDLRSGFTREKLSRYAAVLLVPLVVLAAMIFHAHAELASVVQVFSAADAPALLLSRLSGASLYLGAMLLPWALSHEPIKNGSWISIAIVLALWGAVAYLRVQPAVGPVVNDFGIGLCPFGADCARKSATLLHEPLFWKIVLGLSAFSVLMLGWRLGFAWSHYWSSAWGGYALGFGLAFAVSLFAADFNDKRYLLLFPPLIVLAAGNLKFRWGDFGPLLAIVCAAYFFAVWDTLELNHARSLAGQKLHQDGVEFARISNGSDWNAYYSNEEERKTGKSTFDAIVTIVREPAPKGMRQVGEVPYRRPLELFRTDFVYLWRKWT